MGTFHALCASFLRRYGSRIGLEENFTVCDADERCVIQDHCYLLSPCNCSLCSKKIVAKLLKPYNEELQAKQITIKESSILSHISKAKSKGLSADGMLAECSGSQSLRSEIDHIVAIIYVEYERLLRKNNSLDFDDLLLFGVKLFREHPEAVSWCRHVLVDELYAFFMP